MKVKHKPEALKKIIAKYDDIASSAFVDLITDYEILGYTALNIGGIEVVDDIYPAIGWTDYKKIYINAPYCHRMKLGKEHIKFLIAHEVMHVLTMTSVRGKGRDHKLFNMASDFAINQTLIEDEKIYDINGRVSKEGEKCIGDFIEGGLYNKKYRNWSAEEIYEDLLKQAQTGGNGNASNGSNSSNSQGSNGGSSQNSSSNGNQQQSGGEEQSTSDGEQQASGTYGGEFEAEEQRDNQGLINLDVHLDTEDPQIQQDLKEAIYRAQQIIENAMQQGKLSSGMKRMLGDIPKVKQDWKGELRRYIKSFKKAESSWKRPNKRFFCGGDPVRGGVYFPSQFETPSLNVAIGIDTSGSISDDDVSNFFGHIYKILESYKHYRIQIFCWSMKVHKKTYRDLNEKTIHTFNPTQDWLESDGGTIAQTGFDFVSGMDKKDRPDVYICFTDGYIEDDITFDKCPVIFAINKGINDSFKAPKSCKRSRVLLIED